MSDLISRSELLKRFYVNKYGHRIPERDCDNFEVTVSIREVKTIIKEQPTAYDIDKVVEELNELDVKAIKRYKGGTFGNYEGTDYYIKKSDAIEIVKQEAEQYKGGWISCSKQLPEESGEYLTWVEYDGDRFIAIDEIDCDGIIKEWNCSTDYKVIAWQPLPKPFQKGV